MKFAVLALPCSGNSLNYSSSLATKLSHPAYAWLGIRPVVAQHTAEEHAALERRAANRRTVVEIGVAEGVSAIALRQNMSADGTLFLVDPFHLSRIPSLNFTRRVARRAVGRCTRGRVVWIENFSFDAVPAWNTPIDLLLIDGDHTEKGVRRDWEDWSRFVVPGGTVIFHDARIFDGGWTSKDYGPVKLVDDLFRRQMVPGWRMVEEIHSLVVVERCG